MYRVQEIQIGQQQQQQLHAIKPSSLGHYAASVAPLLTSGATLSSSGPRGPWPPRSV